MFRCARVGTRISLCDISDLSRLLEHVTSSTWYMYDRLIYVEKSVIRVKICIQNIGGIYWLFIEKP